MVSDIKYRRHAQLWFGTKFLSPVSRYTVVPPYCLHNRKANTPGTRDSTSVCPLTSTAMDAHSFASTTTAMQASLGEGLNKALPQVAPLNLSRPLPAESKAGRRTPVPITLPPKYDHAAPHRGLASEPWSASLNSAASTTVDSIFSPAYTDGYQTPLSSIGSPGFLAPSPFTDRFGRKQSIDSIVCAAPVDEEPAVDADHDLDPVDDQLSQVTLVRDTSSPISPISPPEADLEATELTFDLEQHIHDIRVSAFSATSDEFSPTEQSYHSKSFSLSHSTVLSLSSDSSPPALSRSASDAKDDDIPHHGFGPAWESSSVALILDRTGKDARARRSPRGSSQYYRESTSFPTDIIAMATVEVPSPIEAAEVTPTATSSGSPRRRSDDLPSPVAPAYIADDKIALDTFDDEKIFIPGAADMPAARSHFSWGSTPPQRRQNNNPSNNPAFRTQQQQQDADGIYAASPIAATHRINAFTYAQSRHEYSKARRTNFHLPASASRAGMHRDASTNANPSVLAAELDGSHYTQPQQSHHQLQQQSPPPSASSAGGKPYLSSSSHTSSVRGSRPTTRGGRDPAAAPKGGCFGSLFGSCFGPRR